MKIFRNSSSSKPETSRCKEELGVQVIISSRCCADVKYKDKTVRFYGDCGIGGFRAVATSIRWLSPRSDAVISKQERDQWVSLVEQYYGDAKERVYFVDDDGKEYHCK